MTNVIDMKGNTENKLLAELSDIIDNIGTAENNLMGYYWEAGDRLTKLKAQHPRVWEKWASENISLSARQRKKYMQLRKLCLTKGDTPSVTSLNEALEQLTQKGPPRAPLETPTNEPTKAAPVTKQRKGDPTTSGATTMARLIAGESESVKSNGTKARAAKILAHDPELAAKVASGEITTNSAEITVAVEKSEAEKLAAQAPPTTHVSAVLEDWQRVIKPEHLSQANPDSFLQRSLAIHYDECMASMSKLKLKGAKATVQAVAEISNLMAETMEVQARQRTAELFADERKALDKREQELAQAERRVHTLKHIVSKDDVKLIRGCLKSDRQPEELRARFDKAYTRFMEWVS